MKSIDSSERNSIPVKKYLALFGILFVGTLLVFMEHFNEEPFEGQDVANLPSHLQERSEVGFMAPDFTLRNLKNNRVKLTDYRGQVVVLNFWATWCAPCRVEMPAFETLYKRYRSEGLVVLAVSLDKTALEKVPQFVEERHLTYDVLMDTEGTVERLYPSFTIPFTYVIDRTGRIVSRVDGAKNWESEETFEAVEYLLGLRESEHDHEH